MEIGLSGVIAGMVSVFHDDTPKPFGMVIGVTAVLIILFARLANRMDGVESGPDSKPKTF